MNPEQPRRSQHPVDELVRFLIDRARSPTVAEMRNIQAHMSTADFLSQRSLDVHLEARIQDGQWADYITAVDYLRDLRAAVVFASRIGFFVRRGGPICIALAETAKAVHNLGPTPRAELAVIYSADWGRIISGYQFSHIERLWLPDDVLWSVE